MIVFHVLPPSTDFFQPEASSNWKLKLFIDTDRDYVRHGFRSRPDPAVAVTANPVIIPDGGAACGDNAASSAISAIDIGGMCSVSRIARPFNPMTLKPRDL